MVAEFVGKRSSRCGGEELPKESAEWGEASDYPEGEGVAVVIEEVTEDRH
jgi:hypothetical protein